MAEWRCRDYLEGSVCLVGAFFAPRREARTPHEGGSAPSGRSRLPRGHASLHVDQGSSFTALVGHDPAADPWSGSV